LRPQKTSEVVLTDFPSCHSFHYANEKSILAILFVTQPLLQRDKLQLSAGLWLLMPVILAVQEAEIRRIEVQSQPQSSLQFSFG
jgi:hypothetical protein